MHAFLTDFGIALAVQEAGGDRLTGTGLSLGTPSYMSPEQAAGDRELDARSDVYALGAVTYEMLAGEPPVTGASVQAMIAKLMTERPTSLSRAARRTCPPAVDTAVMRALSKAPSDRFATAREYAEALTTAGDHCAAQEPLGAPGLGVGKRTAWTAGFLLIALTGIVLWRLMAGGGPGAGSGNAIRSIAVLPLDNYSGDASRTTSPRG